MDTFVSRWITKKTVLFFSIVAFLFFLYCFSPILSGVCTQTGPHFWPGCIDFWYSICLVIFWAPVLLVFSIVTYGCDTTVFRAWVCFSTVWIVMSSVLVWLTPDYISGYPYTHFRDVVAELLASLFFIVSLAIVLVKSRK